MKKNLLKDIQQVQKLLNDPLLDVEVLQSIRTKTNILEERLVNNELTIAVFAAMKAGKSTFINAMLGQDFLPNETNACTAVNTEIRLGLEKPEAVHKVMKDGTIDMIRAEDSLAQAFHEDVRTVRKMNKYDTIEKYEVSYPIESFQNLIQNHSLKNVTLIDTPGPNEASVEGFDALKLRENAYEQMRNAQLIIFILDYQNYQSNTNAELLQDLFKERPDLEKDQDKVIFILNKIDLQTEKDLPIEQTIENVQRFIQYQTGNTLQSPRVYPVSSLQALYARTIAESSETHQQALKSYFSLGMDGNRVLPVETFSQQLLDASKFQEFEEDAIQKLYIQHENYVIQTIEEQLENVQYFLQRYLQNQISLLEEDALTVTSKAKNSIDEIQKIHVQVHQIQEDIAHLFSKYRQVVLTKLHDYQKKMSTDVHDRVSSYQDVYKSSSEEELKQVVSKLFKESAYQIQKTLLQAQDEFIRIQQDWKQELFYYELKEISHIQKQVNKVLQMNFEWEFPEISEADLSFTMENDWLDVNESSYIKEKETIVQKASQFLNLIEYIPLLLPKIPNKIKAILVPSIKVLKKVVDNLQDAPQESYEFNTQSLKEYIQQQIVQKANELEVNVLQQLQEEEVIFQQYIESVLQKVLRTAEAHLEGLTQDVDLKDQDRNKRIEALEELQQQLTI